MSGADFTARALAVGGFARLGSTDVQLGGQLVGYRASDSLATGRNVADRLDDMLSVKDFGAVGDGVTDDTAAIQAAIRALFYRSEQFYGYRMGTGRLYFPEGVYRITQSGVFTSSEEFHKSSIVLQGAGWRNSILWLDPSALSADAWFYDNFDVKRQWGMVFEDLCFSGGTTWRDAVPETGVGYGSANINSWCNGFKLTGPGWESGFVFNRCEFRFLEMVLHLAGTNNADTHRFVACAANKCNNINYIDNKQSFSVNWFGCYIDQIYGNFLEYGPNCDGGGGNFLMEGGALIALHASGNTTARYVVKAAAGGTSLANAPVTFRDVRFELRGNFHGFANISYGNTQVLASGCSFLNTGTANKNLVTVGQYCTVRFEGTSFSNGTEGGKFLYQIGNAGDGRSGKNAHLIFAGNCIIDPALAFATGATVTWAGHGGRLTIDETCSPADVADASADPRIVCYACDVWGPSSVTGGGLAASTKDRSRKRLTVNPFYTNAQLTGGGGLTGTAVQLPPYTRIAEVWVKIDAGQGNASNVRCLIGNDDKSVIYAQTTVGPQNAGQFVVARDLYIPVGTDTNKRRVRFWFDNGSGGNTAASSAGRVDGGIVYE